MMGDTNLVNIIGQIFGGIAFLVACTKYFQRKKALMMKTSIIAYSFYIVHYFLIGAIAGSYTLLIAIFRDSYIYLRERHHKKHRHRKVYNNAFVFIALFSIYFSLIIINLNTPSNILPLSAGITYLTFEWFTTNKTTLKIAGGITTIPWVFYDIISFSIPALCSDVISMFVCVAGIYKDKKRRTRKRH